MMTDGLEHMAERDYTLDSGIRGVPDSALSPSAHNGGEGEDAHEDAEPSGASW